MYVHFKRAHFVVFTTYSKNFLSSDVMLVAYWFLASTKWALLKWTYTYRDRNEFRKLSLWIFGLSSSTTSTECEKEYSFQDDSIGRRVECFQSNSFAILFHFPHGQYLRKSSGQWGGICKDPQPFPMKRQLLHWSYNQSTEDRRNNSRDKREFSGTWESFYRQALDNPERET